MSTATQFDLTRPQIVEAFRKRIREQRKKKLTREERETLTLILRDRLVQMAREGSDTPEAIRRLCKDEIALLEEGFPQASVNSYYLPGYTRVLKEAIETGQLPLTEQNSYEKAWVKRNDSAVGGVERRHYAFDSLTYDASTQIALRGETTQRNNRRQDHQKPVDLDAYLERVQGLLQASDAETLTVALAAVTGRRHTEVVSLGQFDLTAGSHPYQLHFSGQQKKADAVNFDILTLVPAKEVLEAITRLRALPEVQALVGLKHDAPEIDAFNARVNRRCHQALADVVPVLDGFQSVSIHRLRGLYGTIAIHFFCPEHQREHRFLQHYLGHVLDGEIQPNSRATDHYFHYYLVRGGKPLMARGVKVPANGLLPTPATAEAAPAVIEAEHMAPDSTAEKGIEGMADSLSDEETGAATAIAAATDSKSASRQASRSQRRKKTRISVYADDADRLHRLYHRIAPEAYYSDAMTQLLDYLEQLEQQRHQQQQEQQAEVARLAQLLDQLASTQASQSKHIEWATERIDALERENAQLREQVAAMPSAQQDVEALQAELAAARAKLQQIQGLFGMETRGTAENTAQAERSRRSRAAEAAAPTRSPAAKPTPTPVQTAPKTIAATDQVASPQPTPAKSASSQPRKHSRAVQRAHNIFSLLCEWNRTHPDHAFAITPTLFKDHFGVNAKAAREFVEEYADQVQRANHLIGVEPGRAKYFNRGKDYEALVEYVKARLS